MFLFRERARISKMNILVFFFKSFIFLAIIRPTLCSCPEGFHHLYQISSDYLSLYPPASQVRSDGWVLAVLVLAGAGILITVVIEIFIVTKAHLFNLHITSLWLGQTLLFTLLLAFSLAFAFSTQPSPISCGVIRFSLPLLYSCQFSCLLLKLVSLVLLARESFLPMLHQVLLLILLISPQLALSSQWLALEPPDVCWREVPDVETGELTPNTYQYACNIKIIEFLPHLSYVILILLTSLVISIIERKRVLSEREGIYLVATIIFIVPIWLIWILVSSLTKDTFKYADSSISLGLIATTVLILLLMFMPKVRRLHRLEKKSLAGSIAGGLGGGSFGGSLAGGLSLSALSDAVRESSPPPMTPSTPLTPNSHYNGGSFARLEQIGGENIYSLEGGRLGQPRRSHSITQGSLYRIPSTRSYSRSRSVDVLDSGSTAVSTSIMENKRNILGDNYYYVSRGSPEIIRHGSMRSVRSAPSYTLTSQLAGRPRGAGESNGSHYTGHRAPAGNRLGLQHQPSVASSYYSQRSTGSHMGKRNNRNRKNIVRY